MKTSYFFLCLLLVFASLQLKAQTTIWSENFSGLSYADHTGIVGPGAVNSGDYPAGVTKWTLNVEDCTLEDADDFIKTQYGNLRSRDLDGDAIWQSENIDISLYSTITFSLFAREYGTLEETDYFDVYYKVDAGAFTLIPNWNGFGSTNHTLIDDFNNTTITQTINSGNTLVIKVIMNNDMSTKYFLLDNVFVKANMEYVSSTTTQNSYNIAAGKTNRQIIGIEVATIGAESPINITQFAINANGSSTPVSTNIENAKIYYTGTDNAFATGTQFGSTYASPTTTNFNIAGTQQLSTGTNYFWLTFDTKTGATLGELIDAECISFVIDGSTETPTVTAPAGNRTISAPLSGNYTIGAKSNYASFTAAANDLNNLGISSTVSFAVALGTYTEQMSLSAIDGTSSTNTIVFQSATSNHADVTLQYTPTSTANYVVNFNGSDYISFLDMTVKSTGTSSYGRVFVFDGATQDITLKDNIINGLNITSGINAYAVIYASSGASNMATNINIENNTIANGSYGIYFRGDNDTNLETQNTFIDNVLNNFYYTGINAEYQDAIIITGNTLTGKTSNFSGYGIIANRCNNAMEITQNKVLLYTAEENIGISLNNCIGTAANQGLTANNYVSFETATVTTEGISILNCCYQNIYHNSVNIRASGKNIVVSKTGSKTGIGVGLWSNGPEYGHIKIRNNIVFTEDVQVINVTQTAVDQGILEACDNNDWFFSNLPLGLGQWGNTDCSDLAAWQTASGHDANSVSEDPIFIYDERPATGNENLNESVQLLPDVPRDIDKMPRRVNTTPGAAKGCFCWWGLVSTDWNDPCNWYGGEVPTEGDDVYIDPNAPYQPVLTAITSCRDCYMQEGSSLNANNYNMNIYGTVDISQILITNDNQITFKGLEDTEIKPGSQRYKDLRINKDSDNKGVLVIDSENTNKLEVTDLLIQKGKLEASSVSVSGDADFSGGTVDINDFECMGSENGTLTLGSNTLQSVIINKSGNGQVTLQDAHVMATLWVEKGTMNANNNVEISGDYTVSTAGNNAVVNVAPGKYFEVTGTTTINDGGELRLKSTVSGGGHFIPVGEVSKIGSGQIIIEQYITNGRWHLVSSPVDNATVNSLYFNSNPKVWVREYNEADDDWVNITDLSTPMPFGKGFGYWVETPSDVTTMFAGDLLTDNLTLNNSSTPPLEFTSGDRGYNLVGNPYSCALDWDIGTWERSNLEGSVWVWQDAEAGDGSGNYLVRNLAGEGSLTEGIIPMCQGFFVRATTANPVLTIPTDARVSSSQTYYKKTGRTIAPHLILNVNNNGNQDEVWIGFDENMSTSFDYGRDVNKLFGSANSPQLFIKEQSLQLSVDILPKLISNEERTVAMGFIANANDTYVIAAASLENIPETNIMLEDLKTGILHDLKTNSEYSFSASTQDDANRFLIHFYYSANGIINPNDAANNSGINIYSYNKAIYVKSNDKMAKKTGNISIYDLYGKLLISKEFKSGNLHKIDVPLYHSCVVVRVLKADIITTTKVIIK